MKIYAPNVKGMEGVSGGHTFYRNFVEALKDKVHFVDNWKDSDIFFITGITIVDKEEVIEAQKAGKRIALRVDNVPRKSRNRRSSPHERLKEFAALADVVIYQSEWAKNYCYPLCGEGMVIYNGVNTDTFKPDPTENEVDRNNRYLFIYHGKNEQKGFWMAHYYFQMVHRSNPDAVFWFINDFGSETHELQASNFDFWNGETYVHLPIINTPEDVADLMQQAGYLIYPAICDASPNVVSEALACGMKVVNYPNRSVSGTQEIVERFEETGPLTIKEMADEYYGAFQLLVHPSFNV